VRHPFSDLEVAKSALGDGRHDDALHEAARVDRRFPASRRWMPMFLAVGTDSRAVTPGMLFVALKGERFDGHDFVREVLLPVPPAPWSSIAGPTANPDLPLIPWPTRASRWANWRPPGAPASDCRCSASPAATARPRSRKCAPPSCARTSATMPERAGDRGQPQQRHRPAADAARLRGDASRRGDRDGHEPSGRDRLPDAPRGAHRGAGEQRPARASGRARHGAGCGAGQGRDLRRPGRRRCRRVQCRRSAGGHLARAVARLPQV
jgi:hypothetical protein